MSSFANARLIWKHSRGISRLKLLAAQAAQTRPLFRPVCHMFLKRVSHSGLFWATYDTGFGTIRSSFRLSELSSDILSCIEVGIGDCYRLPQDFVPELILDGGGNIGLFTLHALKRWPSAQAVIFEPVPDNIERIEAHLSANGVAAIVNPFCLGASDGKSPFYVREAHRSSFLDDLPYVRCTVVKVTSLRPYLPTNPHVSCLIKLDIEGAELDVIPDIVKQLSPNILVVGELHQRAANQHRFADAVISADRQIEYFNEGTHALFHIKTPVPSHTSGSRHIA